MSRTVSNALRVRAWVRRCRTGHVDTSDGDGPSWTGLDWPGLDAWLVIRIADCSYTGGHAIYAGCEGLGACAPAAAVLLTIVCTMVRFFLAFS